VERVQFGDYLFAYNPSRIELRSRRQSSSRRLPYLGEQVIATGEQAREVLLEGAFFGQTADEAMAGYRRLEEVYRSRRRGLLFLPGNEPFYALFDRLELDASGDGRILQYSARFLEDLGGEEVPWQVPSVV